MDVNEAQNKIYYCLKTTSPVFKEPYLFFDQNLFVFAENLLVIFVRCLYLASSLDNSIESTGKSNLTTYSLQGIMSFTLRYNL